jgi:hypothetical protein
MTCDDSGLSQRAGYALSALGLCVVLVVTHGCSSRETSAPSSSSAPPSSQPSADDDFLPTVTAALSEGQLTLNNRWTQADLDFEEITLPISYEGAGQPVGRVRSYTTLVQQYRVRRKQCEEDANVLNPNGEPTCYPTLVEAINPINSRYGYYCGGGFPAGGAFFNGTPEPLDGVDYCCRLHDEQVWGQGTVVPFFPPSECGIAMCLSKASGSPANVIARLPDVEAARQYWYDGAAALCGGNQSNDAQPPTLGP